MACARFVAKEVGLAGKTNLEQAQVDEIVDVVQDLINSYYTFYYAKDGAALKNYI